MGKKMKLPSLLLLNKNNKPSWPWPSCHQPKTLSFRAQNDAAFKTINAAYLDATFQSSESFFTVSPNSRSFSTTSEQDSRTLDKDSSLETVIRGLRSDRLFFEPDETSSLLESKVSGTETPTHASLPFKDSVVMSVDSQDPYVDFRRSMEEMLEAQCVTDWEGLQELLCWYLKVNGKTNHGFIVGAFFDLLVSVSSSSSISLSHSPSSPLSFYSSSLSSSCSTRCVSCLEAEDEIVVDDDNIAALSSSSLLQQVREDQPSSSSSSIN